MSQLKSRLISLFLAFIMLLSVAPASAAADTAAVSDAAVYVTVSNKGVIAAANDGSIMANREVTVKDINEDGKLTYDEALAAAHKTYNSEDGYASSDSGISKLWGVETRNTLCFINDVGLTVLVNNAVIEDGDYLVASINADESGCYADWYTFFDSAEKEVKTNEEFALNLKGFYGMAYAPEDLTPAPLSGISIGIWKDGEFSQLSEKATDANGNVSLSFENEGTYYVTASGTVKDNVMDWSAFEEIEMDCPIIAPVCKINVVQNEQSEETDESLMSDEEAANLIYAEFSDKDKNYSNATKTPLVFPLEYNGETYTNVVAYLKAWALARTGKQVIVNYTPYIYTTEYNDWSTGELKKISYDGMDINTEIYQDYFSNNAQKNTNRLDSVSFTVGNTTTDTIDKLCIGVTSKIRTQEEIVDYIAGQLPFERIINTNSSKDEITAALGEKSGSSVMLPNSTGLYGTTSATITWSAENVSGSSDAFSVNSSTRKTTIIRPNVGEENAVFNLKATITSKADEAVSKTVTYPITVVSFEGVIVPIEVTEGAALTLTDKYYAEQVDSKYIVKAEQSAEGYDLYNCILHKSAAGTAQKFEYEVSKDGYITTTDTISVSEDSPEKIVITLAASTEDDAKLKSLSFYKPVSTSHDIVSGFTFDKDTYEYNIKVSGIRTIRFDARAMTEGASVKITSYYKSTSDANNGKLTESPKAISTTCYLPDAENTASTVIITVTAPESSTQEIKTSTYKINIEKVASSGPLTALTLTPVSSTGGKKDSWAGDDGLSAVEGELSPSFVSGTRALGTYTVNYWFDKIKVMPTTISGCTNSVGEENVASGKQSSEIALVAGENKIPISITDGDGNTTNYTLTVYRKSQLEIVSAEVENGAINNAFTNDGTERSNNGRYSYETETLRMKFNTNIENNAGVDIRIKLDKDEYFGKAAEFIEVPVKGKDSAMLFVYLYKTVNDVKECQVYIINMTRMPATSPGSVASYLPAPGQFVNQPIYSNPDATLTGKQMITLGSFGGNVVYKYDTPIENNPMNPYGIDFIVEGNAFTNTDGTSAISSGEPAAVMVSKDGETWYELAGSEYYDANTFHNITVTYENPDTSFAGAVNVPWTDDFGGSGVVLKNEHHKQAYYPNPATYNAYQKGAGKNNTYTSESVSFSGTKTAGAVYPAFGYADNHAAGDYSNSPITNPRGNKAANPYIENHYAVYNGDGFDLDWAVDNDGNPVELDSISYIKIYNPWLYDGGATGEKSPEIMQVLRAEPETEAVGVTGALTALSVNGKAVALEKDKYTYDVDGEGASSFIIAPTSENADANIYVSNQRVSSGESTKAFAAVNKLRIIVQEDNKEPLIYILNFTNVETRESNAELKTLTLTPGDDSAVPDAEGNIEFAVSYAVSSIRFTPELNYQRATAVLKGDGTDDISLNDKTASSAVSLDVGENSFVLTVTSADKTAAKSYNITVTREESSSSSSAGVNTIQVKFSLTGDTVHYDKNTGESTGNHKNPTWIKSQNVTVPKGSTVKYITELMLNNAGIDYTSDGIYVSEINGIGEFDNGPNSGWMYRHNGTIANEGYAARVLSSGDVVKWFYTDDYTKETGHEGGWDKVNSSSSSGGVTTTYTVKFETNGGSTVSSQSVANNGTVTKPTAPEKDGYTFVGWYTDKDLTIEYNFSTKIKSEFTLYAKWAEGESQSDDTSNAKALTDFDDVEIGSWYEEAVAYTVENNLFKGISDAEFAPNSDMTRAMLVTVLYRLENPEEAEKTHSFTDVADGEWYAEAVAWAAENGVVNGVSKTEFAPNDNITREQMAAIIYRYARMKGYDSEKMSVLAGFADANEVSEYALDAVKWANATELINGVSEISISPKTTATRAQVAAIFMRFCRNVKK